MEAASPRLVVSGSGRIALTPEMDAELTVRFADTSLDPYVRFFEPRLSPFTNAVAGGTIRVVGELADVDHLVVETHVESLDLKLFDYRLRNKGTIDLSLDQHVLKVDQLQLTGEGTELQVEGQIAFDRNELSVQASGDANLGILQGFYRDLRSRGTAAIKAEIGGPLDKPVFSGSADITDGRIRLLSVPQLDRGDQRPRLVRRRRRPPGRRGGAAGRRRRAVRRTDRDQRLHARRSQPDRDRRTDADPLPGRVRLDDRRESGAAGDAGRARC